MRGHLGDAARHRRDAADSGRGEGGPRCAAGRHDGAPGPGKGLGLAGRPVCGGASPAGAAGGRSLPGVGACRVGLAAAGAACGPARWGGGETQASRGGRFEGSARAPWRCGGWLRGSGCVWPSLYAAERFFSPLGLKAGRLTGRGGGVSSRWRSGAPRRFIDSRLSRFAILRGHFRGIWRGTVDNVERSGTAMVLCRGCATTSVGTEPPGSPGVSRL